MLAEKAVNFAALYNNPEMVPEMNSMGFALIDKLDELGYTNIYRRKEFDRVLKKSLKKVGWRTTSASKQLLIAHFEELLRKRNPKIYSRETVEELKTFVYTDNAKKKGAGAQEGFHDDHIMATLMASYDEGEVRAGVVRGESSGMIVNESQLVPSITVRDGKFIPPPIPGVEKGRLFTWKNL